MTRACRERGEDVRNRTWKYTFTPITYLTVTLGGVEEGAWVQVVSVAARRHAPSHFLQKKELRADRHVISVDQDAINVVGGEGGFVRVVVL